MVQVQVEPCDIVFCSHPVPCTVVRYGTSPTMMNTTSVYGFTTSYNQSYDFHSTHALSHVAVNVGGAVLGAVSFPNYVDCCASNLPAGGVVCAQECWVIVWTMRV